MIGMININEENIIFDILRVLEIKHTYSFCMNCFMKEPNRYTLYGISNILKKYKINCNGVKVDKKDQIFSQIDKPFVAHVGNDFIVVTNWDNSEVKCIYKNKTIDMSIDRFLNLWSGYALIIESYKDSIEPNYKKNFISEISHNIPVYSLVISLLMIVIYLFIFNFDKTDYKLILFLFFNIIGVFVSQGIVLKKMNIKSSIHDKMCTIFSFKNCNSIIESKASSFLGIFDWGTIGLGFFLTNALIVLINSVSVFHVTFYIFLAIPYALWSILYQKFVLKNWCFLCVIVQVLIGCISLILIINKLVDTNYLFSINTLYLSIYYIVTISLLQFMFNNIKNRIDLSREIYELSEIKYNNTVFDKLLSQNDNFHNVINSRVRFGSQNAKNIITVVTNPHCTPCSIIHFKIEKLLKNKEDLCVQYVFTSFSSELDESSKFLLFIYLNSDISDSQRIFSEWFLTGKYFINKMKSKYEYFESNFVNDEYLKHKDWVNKANIVETPTIIYNGWKIPDYYTIDDLVLFID